MGKEDECFGERERTTVIIKPHNYVNLVTIEQRESNGRISERIVIRDMY
jgi:hypothetical protein